MTEFEKGSFCKSMAGHDKGTVYIIVENTQGIKVADGRYKKLENPKLKNPRHLERIDYKDEALAEKILTGRLRNEDIKYSIKNYHINTKSQQEVNECLKQM